VRCDRRHDDAVSVDGELRGTSVDDDGVDLLPALDVPELERLVPPPGGKLARWKTLKEINHFTQV